MFRLSYPIALLSASAFGMQKDHNDASTHGPASMSKMAQEVRHQLVMLPYYSIFDDLAFRVEGSTVTLLGAVVRPTLKSDAENVVKRIEGVTQVNNQIEDCHFRRWTIRFGVRPHASFMAILKLEIVMAIKRFPGPHHRQEWAA
jgi:hypothetical protein